MNSCQSQGSPRDVSRFESGNWVSTSDSLSAVSSMWRMKGEGFLSVLRKNGRARVVLILILALVFLIGLSFFKKDDSVTIPDTVGMKGDVAEEILEGLGLQVVLDGGEHSVWLPSNWSVESTDPSVGTKVERGGQVIVHLYKPKPPVVESEAAPEKENVLIDSPESASVGALRPEEEIPLPELGSEDRPITVADNADLAALMSGDHDDDYELIKRFSDENKGKVIAFDANIQYMAPHGNAKTRYDFLVGAGDYVDEDTVSGPPMKIEDVMPRSDLNLADEEALSAIKVGQNIYLIARVEKYDERASLVFLDPLETRLR